MDQTTQRAKLWTKDYVLLMAFRLGLIMIFVGPITIMTSYCNARYGVDTSISGVVVGAFIIAALFARLPLAKYTDIIGRRKLLIMGSVAYAIFMACYLLPLPVWGLVIIRALHGFAMGTISNTAAVVMTDVIAESRYGEGLSYQTVTINVGSALGPLLAMALSNASGYVVTFIVFTGIAIAMLIIICCMNIKEFPKDGQGATSAQQAAQSATSKIAAFFTSTVVKASIIACFAAMSILSVTSFIEPYTKVMDYGWIASWYFIINTIAQIATRPFFGKQLDTKPLGVTLVPGLIAFAFGLLLLALWRSPVGVIVAGLFISVGFANVDASVLTLAVRNGSDKSKTVSTFFIFKDGGTGIGPMIEGVVIAAFGYPVMYTMMAIIITLMCVFYLTCVRGKEQKA